eukprot:7382374-Prymnesium_polylepis.2
MRQAVMSNGSTRNTKEATPVSAGPTSASTVDLSLNVDHGAVQKRPPSSSASRAATSSALSAIVHGSRQLRPMRSALTDLGMTTTPWRARAPMECEWVARAAVAAARFSRALRRPAAHPLDVPSKQHARWGARVRGGDALHRRVGRHANAAPLAEGDERPLREARVELDLVDGGRDARVGQQLLHLALLEVGDADLPHLALVHQRLERPPALVERRARVGPHDGVARPNDRPVDQIQVEMVSTQPAERLLECGAHVGRAPPIVPQLARNKYLRARHG